MTPSGMPHGTEIDATVLAATDQIAALLTDEETEPAAGDVDQEQSEDETAQDAVAEDAPDEDAEDTPSPDDPPAATPSIQTKDGVVWTAEEIEKGALRQADYTRKTQAVAEQRKAFEAEAEAVRAERAQYAASLTQLETVLAQQAPPMPPPELRATDPGEYAARMTEALRYQQDQATVAYQRQQVEAKMAEDAARKHTEYLAAERDRLLEAAPEWQDREVAQKELTALRAEGLNRGFTEQELDSVGDHRAILLLRDAMRYRELQAAQRKAQPKIAKARVLAPGTTGTVTPKPVADVRKAMGRLKSSGKVEDGAAVIARMLE